MRSSVIRSPIVTPRREPEGSVCRAAAVCCCGSKGPTNSCSAGGSAGPCLLRAADSIGTAGTVFLAMLLRFLEAAAAAVTAAGVAGFAGNPIGNAGKAETAVAGNAAAVDAANASAAARRCVTALSSIC